MRSLALVVALPLDCRGTPQTTSTAAEPSEPLQAEAGAAPLMMTNAGILSEQEIPALHELTDAKAPPAKGIEIASSKTYLSLPEGAKAPLPGVVVHEWLGMNKHIWHRTDRLAADGYAALAGDLYGAKVSTMKAVYYARAREILTTAHRFLAEDSWVNAKRRGVTVRCFGGGWSLQPDLDAAVIYYGRLETDPEVLAKLEAPVLGVFDNQDAFAKTMQQANESLELHRHDAPHAFANPSSQGYDAKAEDAWNHVRAFYGKHLLG